MSARLAIRILWCRLRLHGYSEFAAHQPVRHGDTGKWYVMVNRTCLRGCGVGRMLMAEIDSSWKRELEIHRYPLSPMKAVQ